MKRRYQIDRQRAVQQFRQMVHEQNPDIQMIFPMAEVVGLLQEGVGHLLREAGLALMNLVMEEEVRSLAGERHQQHPERRVHRWGKEDGYCVVDGQKVPIRRTRLRRPDHHEQRLGSYELFQRSGPLEQSVWDKMMRGLSTRNYGAVVKDLREGATENASVVGELLGDLAARGLDFSVPRLYVLDGGKALQAAVRRHAGEAALIQRCQVHKRRNVVDHLPEEHKSAVRKKIQNAYAMTEYADAKRALDRLHRELMELNPSAARSLEEGMEETLTVHRLRVPAQLRRTLASTNVIESAFSIVETVCRNVKRWRAGDHIERWVGSGLLVAERQFRKVQGYREIPSLLTALANTVSKKAVAEQVKVA